MTTRSLLATSAVMALGLAATSTLASAQEGPVPTQVLVTVDAKVPTIPALSSFKLQLNGKVTPITSFQRVAPNGTQIAILLDDGLRFTVGSDLQYIREFVTGLPQGTEVLVGYMRNGTILAVQPFTTNLEAAATKFRLPMGISGVNGSPYFALSDFVKLWPEEERQANIPPKARFVLMVTNGVDLYNGSTSILNQDSPYVKQAITDAQRAGVSVSSIYYGDQGIRGPRANFSGQSYLQQVADGTGGYSYYQGLGNPVSLLPFLKQFQHDISETYVASFVANAGGGNGRPQLQQFKLSTTPKLKMRHPDAIIPGNLEGVTTVTVTGGAPTQN
jgi:hypothetical protein